MDSRERRCSYLLIDVSIDTRTRITNSNSMNALGKAKLKTIYILLGVILGGHWCLRAFNGLCIPIS